jgi:hypothetical protein
MGDAGQHYLDRLAQPEPPLVVTATVVRGCHVLVAGGELAEVVEPLEQAISAQRQPNDNPARDRSTLPTPVNPSPEDSSCPTRSWPSALVGFEAVREGGRSYDRVAPVGESDPFSGLSARRRDAAS